MRARAGTASIGSEPPTEGHGFSSSCDLSPNFGFAKADRRVSVYYFYIWDDKFGPCFIKICSYFPYPPKVWANGHEWAKHQAIKADLAFSELANGFASCEAPAKLQAICDTLKAAHFQLLFERWANVVPLPLSPADRQAGYWWELSMRQVEVSRTIVFDAPGGRGRFSSPWWPTTSASGAPTRSVSSSAGASAPTPRAPSAPAS